MDKIVKFCCRLPVFAGAVGALGAAGALGATYCSPYITMDGAYHAMPSGQTSALPPTRSVTCYYD